MKFTAFSQVYKATMSLLPSRMDSDEAKAMLLAIGLQESRFDYRRQIGGPARGFWQFELGGGVKGVLNHPASKAHIIRILQALAYDLIPETSYTAIEHNDILACAYARLLLFTLPDALPSRHEADEGWQQYLQAWRPGKAKPDTWKEFYNQAWTLVS